MKIFSKVKRRPKLLIMVVLGFCLLFTLQAFAGNTRLPEFLDLQTFKEKLTETPQPPEINPSQIINVVMVAQSGKGCQVPKLPSDFTISERIISLITTFDIKSGKKNFGKITEKLISLTRSFTYHDASGNKVAEAHAKLLSWGNQVIVTDCQGNKIGKIKEEIIKSIFKVHTIYRILNAQDREIAKSEKVDWIGTSFTLRDAKGRKVAELKRPFINLLSDSWDVKIYNPQTVDSRMIVMIAAYKTSADNSRNK